MRQAPMSEDLVNGLQDCIAELEAELATSQQKVTKLEDRVEDLTGEVGAVREQLETSQAQLSDAETEVEELRERVQPVGDTTLRSLAATIRAAQRNGHPDAPKHLENLLRQLGA